MKIPRFALALAFAVSSTAVLAEPDDPLELEKITIKVVDIHLQLGTVDLGYSTIRKVCMDGQSYILLLSAKGVVGISASFRNGKPEQCTLLADGSAVSVK
jgi:hypothetical protein